jgi:putative ABC transport system substrate-binding protein
VAKKMLDILKQAGPFVGKVAVLRQAGSASHDRMLAHLTSISPAMRVELYPAVMDTADDVDRQFASLRDSGVEAFLALPNPALDDLHMEIGEAGVGYGIPGAGWQRFQAESGFLLSYGPSLSEMHARAAHYVDRILKGASPAELPVEQAERFDLFINLRTAKALGLMIPTTVLARADEVLE